MLFWIREIVGWAFVILGLMVFYLSLGLLGGKQLIEACVAATIGFAIFRGGIHLIKVATAARVVLHARKAAAEIGPQRGANRIEPKPAGRI